MSDNLSFQDLYADSVACIGKSDKISEATKAKIRMLQEQKDKILSVNATKCSESRGRIVKEDDGDVRNCFERDMGRILYSQAFRRLKHKTQVFFNPANDHICSRLEHVIYVDYIASTIGNALNLNVDLIKAIALGHDIGHTPFGHSGERVLNKKLKEIDPKLYFEHESNGLRVLNILEKHNDDFGLNLTFEVRDGIICHCGEIDQQGIKPRKEAIDLYTMKRPGFIQPFTWEGCVVKLADKIAYIGRDIEDANLLGYFSEKEKAILKDIAARCNENAVNTTVVTHSMIVDICENSSPEKGLCFSPEMHEILTEIKDFNYKTIYKNKRLKYYQDYSKLILDSLFEYLSDCYQGEETFSYLQKESIIHPFVKVFMEWLGLYVFTNRNYPEKINRISESAKNKKIYGNLETKELYLQAVIDFIAGMTDNYAQTAFEELLRC